MESQLVASLTVEELQDLIRQTVQQAVSEVMIEMAAAAEMDAKLTYEAEMVDYLRATLQGRFISFTDDVACELDD